MLKPMSGYFLLAGLLSLRAHAAPVEVSLPPAPLWCATSVLHLSADTQTDQAGPVINGLATRLEQAAKDKGVFSIGLPFAASFGPSAQDGAGRTDFTITVCSTVPAETSAPAPPLAAVTQPQLKGLAQVCPIKDEADCWNTVEAAMKAPPWSLSENALRQTKRRSHPALISDNTAENAVSSLLHTKDILLGGERTQDTSPALSADSTVVAILVSATPPTDAHN